MGTQVKKLLAYALAIVVLLAVFALYTRPQLMVALGDMIWACFQ